MPPTTITPHHQDKPWFSLLHRWAVALVLGFMACVASLDVQAAPPYTVTYSGNGATGGSVPTDASSPYSSDATVTVLGNTGSLTRSGYTFNGWNTAGNGSGTNYSPGSTFTISGNTTLYAQWQAIAAPVAGAVSATVAANTSNNSIPLNISGDAPTSVAVAIGASHGTATASGTSITYTPTPGHSGKDDFTYTATNAGGTSSPATVSITVSAPTLGLSPAAGALPSAVAGVGYGQTFTANGGTAPYTYAITAGSLPAGLALDASNGVIGGTPLASGAYNFTVTATDTYHATGAQAYGITVVAAVAPGAPTIGTATAGNTQATVSFTAPASTGGAAITSYVVTAHPNGATGSGSSSPLTVTGLTNGVAYTFTVTATNSAGTGAASAPSNSVTPAAPQTITFGNPGGQNFGTTPTLTATSSAGGGYPVRFTSSTTGVCTITNGGALTFVAVGTCTINADQAGDSSYLAAPQVSQSFTVAPVVPGAPTSVVATAGDTQVSVAFVAPVNTGGGVITSYTVTVNPQDVAAVSSPSSPIVVTGLTNGQAYTFTVTARNATGAGAASVASNSVIPKATQTITFANPGAQNFGTTPTLSATSDSGLTPILTSSTTSVCTITSLGVLTFVTAGTCTINADQPGNSSYLAATQVSHSFAVQAVTAASGSVPGMVGQATATLSGGGPGCTLDPSASGFAPAVSHTTPAGQSMAHGEFAFEAAGCTAPVTMTLVYPEPLPVGVQFWKYGPEVAASNGVVAPSTWFLWAGATPSVDRKTVVYTITDNGVGDADPAVGRIRDPFAPAFFLGGAGAAAIPVNNPWALALLTALVAGLGLRRRASRR